MQRGPDRDLHRREQAIVVLRVDRSRGTWLTTARSRGLEPEQFVRTDASSVSSVTASSSKLPTWATRSEARSRASEAVRRRWASLDLLGDRENL